MNIRIESNARQLQKKLSLFQKKHLGKATNDAMKDAEKMIYATRMK